MSDRFQEQFRELGEALENPERIEWKDANPVDFEERLRALRERIDGYRLIDYKPHSSGNGGRWSEFMKYAENQVEDVGPIKCAECGAWVPCRRPCGNDPEIGVTYG